MEEENPKSQNQGEEKIYPKKKRCNWKIQKRKAVSWQKNQGKENKTENTQEKEINK